jgi:hypothetical protein
MRNTEHSLLILNNSSKDRFENSSVFKDELDNLYKKYDYQSGSIYLFNDIIELHNVELPENEYLYLTISDILDISGTLVNPLDDLGVKVIGSISFVLNGLKESQFKSLKSFYDLDILIKYPEIISMFNRKGIIFFQEFIEKYDGYTGNDSDIIRLWSILDELVERGDNDYDSVISEMTYQLVFNELGLTTETEEESGTIICLLDGMMKVSTYIEYYDYLMDELKELEIGDFQLGYSYWGGHHNLNLYEELELENGDYISYPSLYYKEYICDPETGSWYYSNE